MININMWHNNLPGTVEDNLAVLDQLGGPQHFNHYAWGWTFAGNTPFRRWKRETYRGGISDPLIVHWPAGKLAQNAVRSQYLHAIDLVPTVLDCLGIEPPETIRGVTQSPIEGVSFAQSFDDAEAPSQRHTQYFEMMGHRSIYHDGWRAVCPWPGPSFAEAGKFFGAPISAEGLTKLDATGWELYHITEDFAENHNVADQNRDKLIETDLALVRRGRQIQRAAHRFTRSDPPTGPEAAGLTAARSLRLLPRHPGRAGQRHGQRDQSRPQHHRRGRCPGGWCRRRASLLWR